MAEKGNGNDGDPAEQPKLVYGNYLQLDKILGAQKRESEKGDSPAHDEHLFIIVHQAYELWFKQIIWELDSITEILETCGYEDVMEKKLRLILSRGDRVKEIFKVVVQQVKIVETIEPQEFVDFRDWLFPASGFESLQFRLLENKLGIRKEDRVEEYRFTPVNADDAEKLSKSEKQKSLLQLAQTWLEHTFDKEGGEAFWKRYEEGVKRRRSSITDEAKRKTTKDMFDNILDEGKHDELEKQGKRKLSHRALKGVLMINYRRDELKFQQPYQFLRMLMDIDELLYRWRWNHVMMVQRMLGDKPGTGGGGYKYLRSTVCDSDNYKVFLDLFNISTFLIPTEVMYPSQSDASEE
ncbi:tryptophan 2,3-dioxygenase-like [Branchiostoma floridae]|uniref:Tryptophan 2,3-dioxygenase-like n=1 Tax=Branchiostoma floridae TaxID=7739 RepID=A0A9J7LVC0_BRAFL|nr:tryptophan 2,3-dioxygenase-like [Branchiostoma floridae]